MTTTLSATVRKRAHHRRLVLVGEDAADEDAAVRGVRARMDAKVSARRCASIGLCAPSRMTRGRCCTISIGRARAAAEPAPDVVDGHVAPGRLREGERRRDREGGVVGAGARPAAGTQMRSTRPAGQETSKRSPSRAGAISRPRRQRRAPVSRARAAIGPSACAPDTPLTTISPPWMIAAFSRAIAARVPPRRSRCSSSTFVITLTGVVVEDVRAVGAPTEPDLDDGGVAPLVGEVAHAGGEGDLDERRAAEAGRRPARRGISATSGSMPKHEVGEARPAA